MLLGSVRMPGSKLKPTSSLKKLSPLNRHVVSESEYEQSLGFKQSVFGSHIRIIGQKEGSVDSSLRQVPLTDDHLPITNITKLYSQKV